MRAKPSGTGWIVITVAQPEASLPPQGQRVTPATAQFLPKIVSPNSAPAIATEPAAHNYRLVGLDVSVAPGVKLNYGIVTLGDGSSAQNSLTLVPTDIVIDRCYIHGDVHQAVVRGVALNSARTAVIDSYISEIHAPGQDSQALCGWNGPGPFKIANNFLSASTENVMFGGAFGAIPEIVPSDIEIVGNHLYKKSSWLSTDPNYGGDSWSIKNLLELKNARRVLITENLFDQGLKGYAILLTVRTQRGQMPWNVVEDVTVANNQLRHIGGGINILARDDEGNYTGITQRIRIENNLFEDIDAKRWSGSGWAYLILGGPPEIQIDHNTAAQSASCTVYADGSSTTGVGFEYTNNIAKGNICGSNFGPGKATLARYFPGSFVTNNILAGAEA
ncbi:MAG TPA: hypothetical protein VN673_01310, partial [Clostridia bacterium]|nr:hypothetical protein [Clostridia bacterium]